MTGAGSANVAIALEETFLSLPDIPEWFQPGENVTVGTASLERSLERARQPDDPRPDGSTEGNLEGAFTVSFDVTDTNWHDLVFIEDTPAGLAQGASFAPTATVYLSADLPGTTEERFLAGAAVESMSLNYSEGENVTLELTFIYFDEPEVGGTHGDAPGTIQQPGKADIVRGHGFDFDIAGGRVEKLQSMSVDVSGMARPRPQQENKPADIVVGAYEPTASVQAIIDGGTQRSLMYGSSTAVEPLETVDESSGTVSLENPAGALVSYNLTRMQPDSYDWSDLVSADTDVTEPVDYHFSDLTVA